LWPKFEDPEVGMLLAYTGAVKENIIDTEELACHLIERLWRFYPDTVRQRYKVDMPQDTPGYILLEEAGRKRGFLISGGEINTERTAITLLEEFRNAKIGNITIESPEDKNA
jgi:ribosome biogenesis GTPase A